MSSDAAPDAGNYSPVTAFSEPLKQQVWRKAHFACCLCKGIGVEAAAVSMLQKRMVGEVKDAREKFEPRGQRERDLVRNAIRWHMTGCDGGIRSEDTEAVWDHGWTGEEKARIEEILCNGAELSKVLLAWCRHDEAKRVSPKNAANRQRIQQLLADKFFVSSERPT